MSTRPASGLLDLRGVPAGVRDVIGSRLNRLSPQCSHALGNAAVIGRRFDFGLLEVAARRDARRAVPRRRSTKHAAPA